MAMYAIATIHLIKQQKVSTEVEQVWYADNSAAGREIRKLHKWWDKILEMGLITVTVPIHQRPGL